MKTKSRLVCLSGLLISLFLAGCATSPKMNYLSVGMTKKEVVKVMGWPASTAAPGNGMEILRYELSPTDTAAFYGITQEYFVKLVDGKVISYGRAGDFNSTKDPTFNLNVHTTSGPANPPAVP